MKENAILLKRIIIAMNGIRAELEKINQKLGERSHEK